MKLSWVKIPQYSPPFANKKETLVGAKYLGKLYERNALKHLNEFYKDMLVESIWFQYKAWNSNIRWCQPDALLIDIKKGVIIIVEIKLKHTRDCYRQLRELYLPVVSHYFGDSFKYGLCELVKWYDVGVPFPEPIVLNQNVLDATSDNIQVSIWKE